MSESLDGKVILVTGGAGRIGRSIALRLADEGARGGVHYHEAEDEGREVGRGGTVRANRESVTEIRSMFEEVGERFGRLDGLVNNAGRFTGMDPLEIE